MFEIVRLTNGKNVGNFSSPHQFIFTDNSVLPAQSNEIAEDLKIDFIENEISNGDITLDFYLSIPVIDAMQQWMDLWVNKKVDVVFCPLPMITAIKRSSWYGKSWLRNSPFRSIRIEDRINKLVSISKQCIQYEGSDN